MKITTLCTILFGVTLSFSCNQLAQNDYDEWKQREQATLQTDELFDGPSLSTETFLDKISSLMRRMNSTFDQLAQKPSDILLERDALYIYNYLRELLNRSPALLFADIDKKWLKQVKSELICRTVMETRDYSEPTATQVDLLNQALKLIQPQDNIYLFSCNGAGESFKQLDGEGYIISIGKDPDTNFQKFALHHEIGHVIHQDNIINIGKALGSNKKKYKEYLNDPTFKADIDLVLHYIELGKKAFNKSTPIGRHIIDILSRYPDLPLWEPPKGKAQRIKMLFLRGQEQRADLFALQKLFDKGDLEPILTWITDTAFGCTVIPVIAKPIYQHPSDLERALYATGFLVDKGVDINKTFQQWFAKGKCKGVPSPIDMFLPKTQGALDLINAHKVWLQAHYEAWKKQLQNNWKENDTSQLEQTLSLLSDALTLMAELQKHSFMVETEKLKAFHIYNFARELLDQTTVKSYKDIDESWLKEQEHIVRKKVLLEKWQKAGKTTLPEQALSLLHDITEQLDLIQKYPDTSESRKRLALFGYNFLRELLHQTAVSSFDDIDTSWLHQQYYTFWKDEQLNTWQTNGNVTLTAQALSLLDTITFKLDQIQQYPEICEPHKRHALFAYNFLRELLHQTAASSFDDIDTSWLHQQDYAFWKENLLNTWPDDKVTLSAQALSLLSTITSELNQIQQYPHNSKSHKRSALFAYNFLRELLHQTAASSFDDIDTSWLHQQDYTFWKEMQLNTWQAVGKVTLPGQALSLVNTITSELNFIQKYPEYSESNKRRALFAYNFLRELLHQPTVSSFYDIDHSWLHQQDYIFWKDELLNNWQIQGIITLTTQALFLLYSITSELNSIQQYPEYSEAMKRRALFAYNFLRELLQESTVPSFYDIDHSWLHQQDYVFWKEKQLNTWQTDGKTTLTAQALSLLDTITFELNYIQQYPDYSEAMKRSILFQYNFLRELFQESTIASLQDIDQSWLTQQNSNLRKSNVPSRWSSWLERIKDIIA